MADAPTNIYEFKVKMTCSGCSGAVSRALDKAKNKEEVSDFKVSLDDNTATVWSVKSYEEILTIIKKTGKEVLSGTTIDPSVPVYAADPVIAVE